MRLLLRGGRVVDPASGTDARLDVLVEDGRIAAVGALPAAGGGTELDVAGLVVCPGFIDMHVHLREPGQAWKETIAAGTRAAARGGFTAVACMPNTSPVNDCRAVTDGIRAEAERSGVVAVHPIACVTRGQLGRELVELERLVEAGVRAFSDDGKPVASALALRDALVRARRLDVAIVDHCEDPDLVAGGAVHDGPVAERRGLRGRPGIAEDLLVQRDILLAEETGGHVHVAHLSTGRSAGFVREAKRRGAAVTCEVTPHHLILTDAAVDGHGADAKVNPPLRPEADRRRLLEELAAGTIDAIATDHAPHHADEKALGLDQAPPGIVGLETAVPLCLDRLVHGGVIGLGRLVELFTTGPAGILRLERGRLRPGAAADLTLLDLERRTVVDPSQFASLGRNTPFAGWVLRGAAVMTIVAGRIVHDSLRSPRA